MRLTALCLLCIYANYLYNLLHSLCLSIYLSVSLSLTLSMSLTLSASLSIYYISCLSRSHTLILFPRPKHTSVNWHWDIPFSTLAVMRPKYVICSISFSKRMFLRKSKSVIIDQYNMCWSIITSLVSNRNIKSIDTHLNINFLICSKRFLHQGIHWVLCIDFLSLMLKVL